MTNELATTTGGELAKYAPEEYNVLTAVVAAQDIPQGARMSVRVVNLDTDGWADSKTNDIYPVPGGTFGIKKTGIMRLLAAAGVTVLEQTRVDDGTKAHVYAFRSHVRVVDPDGLSREMPGNKTVDLSDDGKDYNEIVTKAQKKNRDWKSAILEARKWGAESCATKSLLRAVRDLLLIKTSYTRTELQRPFVVPKLILDATDPQAKALLLSSMVNAQAQLYPPADRGSVGEDIVASNVDANNEPTQEPGPDEPSQEAQTLLDQTWEYSKKHKIGKTEFSRIFKEIGKTKAELTVNDVKGLADKLAVRAEELSADAADDGIPV